MVNYYFYVNFDRTNGANWCSADMTAQILTRMWGGVEDANNKEGWTSAGQVICNLNESFMQRYSTGDRRALLIAVHNSIFSGFSNTPIGAANLLCASPDPKQETPFLTSAKRIVHNGRFQSNSGYQNGFPLVSNNVKTAQWLKSLKKPIIDLLRLNDFSESKLAY